jgi:hypothetical protein
MGVILSRNGMAMYSPLLHRSCALGQIMPADVRLQKIAFGACSEKTGSVTKILLASTGKRPHMPAARRQRTRLCHGWYSG